MRRQRVRSLGPFYVRLDRNENMFVLDVNFEKELPDGRSVVLEWTFELRPPVATIQATRPAESATSDDIAALTLGQLVHRFESYKREFVSLRMPRLAVNHEAAEREKEARADGCFHLLRRSRALTQAVKDIGPYAPAVAFVRECEALYTEIEHYFEAVS